MPLLRLVLLVSLTLAACGGDEPTTDEPTTPGEQSASTAPASETEVDSQPTESASSPTGGAPVEDATAEFTLTLTGGEYEGTYDVATNQPTGCTLGVMSEGMFFAQFGGTEGEDPVVYIDLSVPDWDTVREAGTTETFATSVKFAPATMPHAMVDTVPGSAFAGGSGTVTITGDGDLPTVTVAATTADDVGYELTVVCHSMF